MGFLSDLVDDVFDTTEKIVRSPTRILCAWDDHEWEWSKVRKRYRCALCAAEK